MSLSKKLIYNWLRIVLLLLIYQCSPASVSAQPLSDEAKISVLTCGPGSELYARFGHTAIRVSDSVRGIDRVYNYGTFDFNQRYFYWRFLMGTLEYELATTDFEEFYEEYTTENRSIYEQVLNFDPDLLNRIYDSLEINARPENRGYYYDFFEDNCTTRVLELIYTLASDSTYNEFFTHPSNLTYRKELRPYIQQNPWLSLGINLLLGRHADTKITNYQSYFLPENLMNGLAKTDWAEEPNTLFASQLQVSKENRFFNPMIVFWLVAVLFVSEILFMKTSRRTSTWFDMVIFTLTGLLGLLFLSLRLFSDHPSLQSNLNILWANPLNLLFVLFLFKDWNKAAKIYAVFYAILLSFCLVTWNRMPQQMTLEIMPILALLAFRTFQRIFVFVEKPEKLINQ